MFVVSVGAVDCIVQVVEGTFIPNFRTVVDVYVNVVGLIGW